MSKRKLHKLGGWGLCGLVVIATLGGCTRRFFRERADREVDRVLAQKDRYPFWKIENYHVYPDPRARFADPTNPDRPPMPPDDPAARELGPNPQKPGRAGVAWIEGDGYLDLLRRWDALNRGDVPGLCVSRSQEAERTLNAKQKTGIQPTAFGPKNPPPELLPPPKKPAGEPGSQHHPFRLKLEQAAELGLINSREFQTKREDLYLTALPVTLQRFAFAPQFFATEEAIREWAGRDVPGGRQNRWTFNSDAGFSKLFSTGALLLLQFANQTVIDLTGNAARHTVSETTLNLDLVQPLLRGGGRAATLEALTQSERDLLYEIRAYARFRKQFFANLATGGDFDVFNVQPVRQGFLPTLQRQSRLLIEKKSVAQLEEERKFIKAMEEGGVVTPLQVRQVDSRILDSQSNVLQREQDFLDALDRFKLQLGVPVHISLDLDDEPLRPIRLHLERGEEILKQLKETIKKLDELSPAAEALKLRGRLRAVMTSGPLAQGTPFQKDFPKRWKILESLPEKALKEKILDGQKERQKLLLDKAKTETAGKEWPETKKLRLEELEQDFQLGGLEEQLRKYEAQPWLKEANEAKRRTIHNKHFQEVAQAFARVLEYALKDRLALWRKQWPGLAPIVVAGHDLLTSDLEAANDVGTQAALTNRLDLMNQRARVTDAWRQIAVTANSLLGVFNIEYHLSSFSPTGKAQPLLLDGSRVSHQLALNGQLPLVRKAERNIYRAALIDYQRERRQLMSLEDNIVAGIRRQIRQLRVLAQNYTIQQEAVELAYNQLENAREAFLEPPEPGKTQDVATRAAALTNQLLQSQNNLVGSLNQLYTIWTNYQNTRMQLYRDLELMPLDFRGVWIDELATRESHPGRPPVRPGQPELGQPDLPPARLLGPAEGPPAQE